ncbi:hypothetical protein ACA910_014258 [Epithemia clementina (nom. ined.)]
MGTTEESTSEPKRSRDDGADPTGTAVADDTEASSKKRAKQSSDANDQTTEDSDQHQKTPWSDANIPNTAHYHISWMHAEDVTHVAHNSKHGYVVSGSKDGVVKFWKRLAVSKDNLIPLATSQQQQQSASQERHQPCLEFVKSFTAHEKLHGLAMEDDWCASLGTDEIQIYDVRLFDSLALVNSKPAPDVTYSHATWFGFGPENAKALAVAVQESGAIYLYSTISHAWMQQVVTVHGKNAITAMVYDNVHRCMITGDRAGILELWDCQGEPLKKTTNSSPSNENLDEDSNDANNSSFDPDIDWLVGGPLTSKKHGIQYTSKLDTDLYALVKKKTFAIDIAITCTTNQTCYFAVYSQDDRIRIFDFKTASIAISYDERLKTYDKIYSKPPFLLDSMEYGTRAAKERQMQKEYADRNAHHGPSILSFDVTGKYLVVSTMMGVKVIDWHPKRHKLVCMIGNSDASQLRFTNLCLCPGPPKIDTQMELARRQQNDKGAGAAISVNDNKKSTTTEVAGVVKKTDALLIALAYQQRRLYVFSQYDVVDDPEAPTDILTRRDIWNEAPTAQDYITAASASAGSGSETIQQYLKSATTVKAILRTTMGDIHLQLFAKQTPKTIENFVGHARSHYYDNVIFHRVLKGFMIQTGDPLGDGTGGESIWGGDFNDEFVPGLRHDRPFVLSMANAGPNTNGSQFFITTVPCPWLDQKHTVFGRVVRGMDVCTLIENVKTDHRDKPLVDIRIISIDIE